MRIFTNKDVPKDLLSFLFDHRFFTKVLFTFGLLYILTPCFLYLYKNYQRTLIIFLVISSIFIVVIYNHEMNIPYTIKKLLLDRTLFLYPILPALTVYSVGFFIANKEIGICRHKSTSGMGACAFLIIFIHLFLVKIIPQYKEIVSNKQYFTLIESLTPYMVILVARYLITIKTIYNYVSSPRLLCIGILSLHFYVISNLFIGLLSIPRESDPLIKLFGLLGVGFLSYLFTSWRFGAIQNFKFKSTCSP